MVDISTKGVDEQTKIGLTDKLSTLKNKATAMIKNQVIAVSAMHGINVRDPENLMLALSAQIESVFNSTKDKLHIKRFCYCAISSYPDLGQ